LGNRKHDYSTLRLEYIQTDISIRALAEKHGIRSWSTVNAVKRAEGWDDQRAEFKAKHQESQIEALVTQRMETVATIHHELLVAIRAAVHRYVDDVQRKEDPQSVSARDLIGLMQQFLLLTGQATARSENRSIVDAAPDFAAILRDAPPDLLRELAEVARNNGAGAGPVGRGPLIVLEGTRSA